MDADFSARLGLHAATYRWPDVLPLADDAVPPVIAYCRHAGLRRFSQTTISSWLFIAFMPYASTIISKKLADYYFSAEPADELISPTRWLLSSTHNYRAIRTHLPSAFRSQQLPKRL